MALFQISDRNKHVKFLMSLNVGDVTSTITSPSARSESEGWGRVGRADVSVRQPGVNAIL